MEITETRGNGRSPASLLRAAQEDVEALTVGCPVCSAAGASRLGTQRFYLGKGNSSRTILHLCKECGSVFRQILDGDAIRSHSVEGASYTDIRKADYWQTRREPLFRLVLDLIQKADGRGTGKILDVGCGYGHMLRLLVRQGWTARGVEPSPKAAAYARSKFGLGVIEGSIEEVNLPARSFDVVTLIDSLYYSQVPVAVLERVRGLLKPSGLIVVRQINRAPLVRLWSMLIGIGLLPRTREVPFLLTGDAITIPTMSALRRLLSKTGFSPARLLSERPLNTRQDWRVRLLYCLGHLLWLGSCGRILVSPGVIALARKDSASDSPRARKARGSGRTRRHAEMKPPERPVSP